MPLSMLQVDGLGNSERGACTGRLKQSRTTPRPYQCHGEPDDESDADGEDRSHREPESPGAMAIGECRLYCAVEGRLLNRKRVQRIWRRQGADRGRRNSFPRGHGCGSTMASCKRLRRENKPIMYRGAMTSGHQSYAVDGPAHDRWPPIGDAYTGGEPCRPTWPLAAHRPMPGTFTDKDVSSPHRGIP